MTNRHEVALRAALAERDEIAAEPGRAYTTTWDVTRIVEAALAAADAHDEPGEKKVPLDGGRCEDYDTEVGVYYHAHDLPRCLEQGVCWYEGRWICERHTRRRMTPATREADQ